MDEAKNFQHTVFYYRSIRDAIPMYGTLEIASGDARFEIPTSFKEGKGFSGNDYSNFELRAWKPFYVPTYKQTLQIKLDEHEKYVVNILEGLQFFDAREVANSTEVTGETFAGEGVYSIAESNFGVKSYFRPMLGWNVQVDPTQNVPAEPVWGWVIGNTEQDGTVAGSTEENPIPSNGFAEGVSSFKAYNLQVNDFVFDQTGIPADLRRLITIVEGEDNDGVPTYKMEFDYNSQVSFRDKASIEFAFKFQTPWQKFDDNGFVVVVEILGLNAQ